MASLLDVIIVIVAVFFQQCHGTCKRAQVPAFTNTDVTIESPNFGHEYGKSGACNWYFRYRVGYALVLNITQMQLFYNDVDKRKCISSSIPPLTIFGRAENCTEHIDEHAKCYVFVPFIRQGTCFIDQKLSDCNQRNTLMWSSNNPISVNYINSGYGIGGALDSNATKGFRMTYQYVSCRAAQHSTTTAMVAGMNTITSTTIKPTSTIQVTDFRTSHTPPTSPSKMNLATYQSKEADSVAINEVKVSKSSSNIPPTIVLQVNDFKKTNISTISSSTEKSTTYRSTLGTNNVAKISKIPSKYPSVAIYPTKSTTNHYPTDSEFVSSSTEASRTTDSQLQSISIASPTIMTKSNFVLNSSPSFRQTFFSLPLSNPTFSTQMKTMNTTSKEKEFTRMSDAEVHSTNTTRRTDTIVIYSLTIKNSSVTTVVLSILSSAPNIIVYILPGSAATIILVTIIGFLRARKREKHKRHKPDLFSIPKPAGYPNLDVFFGFTIRSNSYGHDPKKVSTLSENLESNETKVDVNSTTDETETKIQSPAKETNSIAIYSAVKKTSSSYSSFNDPLSSRTTTFVGKNSQTIETTSFNRYASVNIDCDLTKDKYFYDKREINPVLYGIPE